MDVEEKKKAWMDQMQKFPSDGCTVTLDDNGQNWVLFFNQRYNVGIYCKLEQLQELMSVHVKDLKKRRELDKQMKESGNVIIKV